VSLEVTLFVQYAALPLPIPILLTSLIISIGVNMVRKAQNQSRLMNEKITSQVISGIKGGGTGGL